MPGKTLVRNNEHKGKGEGVEGSRACVSSPGDVAPAQLVWITMIRHSVLHNLSLVESESEQL
jgi:hypothetical protein